MRPRGVQQVEAAVSDRFADRFGKHPLLLRQIGDCARHTQQPQPRTGRQVSLLHGLLPQMLGGVIELNHCGQLFALQGAIASTVRIARLHPLPGLLDPLGHDRCGLGITA